MYTLPTFRQADSAQLLHIYRLLEQVYGLTYDSPDAGLVAQAIADRMEARGVADVETYARLLEGDEMAAELRALVDRATVRETRFFREGDLFSALADEIVPAILDRNLHTGCAGRPLTVWSAGCSTGDEAYSVAIVLLEMARNGLPLSVRVIGTDVSPSAIAHAASGVYPESVLNRIDSELVERYFRPVWLSDNHELAYAHEARSLRYKVVDELAECVSFREHNLTAFPYPGDLDGFDLILCRNVLMYFAEETAFRVIGELSSRLNEGGYLILDPWLSCARLAELGLQHVRCRCELALRKVPQRERASRATDERRLPGSHADVQRSRQDCPAENCPGENCSPRPSSPESCPIEGRPVGIRSADYGSIGDRHGANRSLDPGSTQGGSDVRHSPDRSAQEDVEVAISQARMSAGRGDWARAQLLLAAAEQLAPLDPRVYRLMGEVHLQRSDLEAASRCFARVIYLQPRNAVAYWRMAHIYRRMHRHRDEMRQLHNVLQCIECSEARAGRSETDAELKRVKQCGADVQCEVVAQRHAGAEPERVAQYSADAERKAVAQLDADIECEVSEDTLMRACLHRIEELRRDLREERRARSYSHCSDR